MSIETLLEAAKFLELQSQHQQRAREDELKEKLRLQQKTEYIYSDGNYNPIVHINNVPKAEELRAEPHPAPVPSSLPPPSVPAAVVPIPVVTPNPTAPPPQPVATLSPPAAPSLASPQRDLHSPQEQSAAAALCAPPLRTDRPASKAAAHHRQNPHHPSPLTDPSSNAKPAPQQTPRQLVHCYPGSVVSISQHHTLLPHPGPVLQPAPLQNGPVNRGSPTDDSRQLDKKRPGGAGTREVHNKLEKNRRAHLKECFETLKKNVPNIDEKKTSNLSVLRSALRYIQTLKRKEKEYEHDMERLAREKIATQQRLAELKNELSQWMDVVEIDRVLRQTAQPEEDQASTSTASEGEDAMEEDLDEETSAASPSAPRGLKPELHKTAPRGPAPPAVTASIISKHISIQNRAPLQQPTPQPQARAAAPTSTTQTPLSTQTPSLHPTVIAHASVSHPSVIQTLNHVIHGGGPQHVAHLAPSSTSPSSVQLAPGAHPISHITVHPVAHLGPHMPTLYSQPVAVTQPAVVGHIAHTLSHAHVNGSSPNQAAVGKQGAVMARHPQLVGQTVLNPVTMVTVPSFPISTLKLA
ncbi:max-binding protein MNT [Austrofundulus limnaeus]|uniref:Max-binding protein MNT n=1 Tax=Austrofundulus limnaeus TaxID=52670 RepID=A0A2I4AZ22_AUSLI|nr:PREDICTED: max-binding protein MNT [Austrofundulus limnaeus]